MSGQKAGAWGKLLKGTSSVMINFYNYSILCASIRGSSGAGKTTLVGAGVGERVGGSINRSTGTHLRNHPIIPTPYTVNPL